MLIVCPNCASEYDVDPAILGPDGRRVRCTSCGEHWFAAWHSSAEPPDEPAFTSMEASAPSDDDLEAQWRAAALNDPDVQEALAQASGAEEATGPHEAAAHEVAPEGDAVTAAVLDQNISNEPVPAATGAEAAEAETATTPRKPTGRSEKAKGRKGSLRRIEEFRTRPRPSRAGLSAMLGLCLLGLTLWQRETLSRYVPALAGPMAAIGLPVNIRGAEFANVGGELLNDPSGRFLIVQAQISNVTSREVTLAPLEIVVRDVQGKAIYTWAAEPQKLKLAPGETLPFRSRLAQPPREAHDVQLRFQRASAQMAQAAK